MKQNDLDANVTMYHLNILVVTATTCGESFLRSGSLISVSPDLVCARRLNTAHL